MNINKLTYKTFKLIIRKLIGYDIFPSLEKNVIELNSFEELKKLFGWAQDPIMDRPDLQEFVSEVDVNERRIRDAESLAVIMRNAQPKVALEIGTANGIGTALMAINAPNATIHTINILPEEISEGSGGKLTTAAFDKEDIGAYYREKGLTNIQQIYANSATWIPNIGNIDVAMIDGCHDAEFVFNDTLKVLNHMRPGGFILWHDFDPKLVKVHPWIHSVCLGVERLYQHDYLTHHMFIVRDSWTGIYRV